MSARTKPAPHALGSTAEAAVAAVLSPRTGIVTSVVPFISELLPRTMVARMARATRPRLLPGVGGRLGVTGFGVGTSEAEAWPAAVGETVERYGAVVGAAGMPVEWGTFREFEGDAVPGDSFMLPSPGEKSSPYAPFDEKTPRGWVAGHDLTHDQRVLVPAQMVLPSYRSKFEGENLVQWNTTGLSAHTDPATAVLAGLREVQERDAFTIRHLNRWTPPEIPVTGVSDDVDGLLASTPRWHPLTVRAWDLTLDLGQPVVLAGVFPQNEQLPPFCFGAACRGDRPSALRKAVMEAFQIVAVMKRNGFPQSATDKPLDDIADPEEHVRVSCLPGYRSTLSWLLDERAEPTPAPGPVPPTRHTSRTSLSAAVAAVARRGLRVISVDLTPPDVRELGWHVCQVLVPGAQPLYFGRVQALKGDRLYRLPVELGQRTEPAREADLHSAPHPFA